MSSPTETTQNDSSNERKSLSKPAKEIVAPPPKPVHDDYEKASDLCNKWVESGVTKCKPIQYLLQTLIDLGCTPPEHFIRCVQCEQPQAGGFGMVVEENRLNTKEISIAAQKEQCQRTMKEIQEQLQRDKSGISKLSIQPEIFVCQQYMQNEYMTHKTVHHELIHAIDMCRTKMDPLRNCIHLACTEIRAENLSGECSFGKEFPHLISSPFRGHGYECVRRRAILSVKANPNCTARAEEYVDAALPRCFQDVYPYHRHPNQG